MSNTIHSNSTSARINGSTFTLEPGDTRIELEQPIYGTWPILMDIEEGQYTWNGKKWEKD